MREPTGPVPLPDPPCPADYVGEQDIRRVTAQLAALPQPASRWAVFAEVVERLRILHLFAVGLVGSVVWGAVAAIWYTSQWVGAVQAHQVTVEKEITTIKSSAAIDHDDLSSLRDQFDVLRVQVTAIVDGVTEMRGLTRELARQQGIVVTPMPHIEPPPLPRRHHARAASPERTP
jgi:hypothetical protein